MFTSKTKTFLAGMAKAFDFNNSRRVFNRKRLDSTIKLYGEEKTDTERLAGDWLTIGQDMKVAMARYGEQYGK